MSLQKEIVELIDGISEYGDISIKEVTKIVEDGKSISESIHRRVISFSDDLSSESDEIKAIAAAKAPFALDKPV